ncbi:hypothetical protein PRIPAC_74242 [Pristionchus pacificus]|uniref:BPTI/Kunitz inhibitor domain-containing protein n=1 Tax=Pristionchus pacificus TaxID=54126 RepID=A0A2A6C009_PRIPA|nr:hypothetical protein PRIPAC_74242 [Pristionchus pacificus]|eukprot:PDM71439.1 hypothetical protein PRIPAC_37846 [Pristionchus pacificus]
MLRTFAVASFLLPLGRCQPFFFLGCGGNDNNFIDKRSCEEIATCSLSTSAVLQDKATACRSPSDCAAGHACSNGSCCPTKEHICSLTPDNGNEATEFVHRGRYAWIPSLKNCIRFSYFGVNGNANNFPSYKECVAFCGAQ